MTKRKRNKIIKEITEMLDNNLKGVEESAQINIIQDFGVNRELELGRMGLTDISHNGTRTIKIVINGGARDTSSMKGII